MYDKKYMITKLKRKGLLAFVSGILLAMAMPGFPFGAVVFVGLIPLFFGLEGGRGFGVGWWTGLTLFGLDLRWFLTLWRFSPLTPIALAALVIYFSLYLGAFGWGVNFARRRFGEVQATLLAAPLLYAGLEILRAHGPLGSCFSDLYLGLYRMPFLIQWASVVGPWGITAAIVFVNGAIYLWWKTKRITYLAVAAGMFVIMAAGSLLPVQMGGKPIKAAVISSDIPQSMKLDARNLFLLLSRYTALGQEAANLHPDLIVYPESILPAYILEDADLFHHFSFLAKTAGCSVLLGTGDLRKGKIYNSVVLISPDGGISGIYDMVHPVPFGEYIPWRSFIDRIGLGRFAASFLPVDLARGHSFSPLEGIGTPICFESTFPAPARRFVHNGADILVTVTNDAWFDKSSELPVHFAFAVFRAVENRRYLIQAANGGISGVVDPKGYIVKIIHGEGVLSAEVQRESGRSPYSAVGEWPLYACFGFVVLLALSKRGGWRGV